MPYFVGMDSVAAAGAGLPDELRVGLARTRDLWWEGEYRLVRGS